MVLVNFLDDIVSLGAAYGMHGIEDDEDWDYVEFDPDGYPYWEDK